MRVQFRSNCCPCNVELTKGINFLDAPYNVVKVLLDSKTRRKACRVSVEKAQQGWVNRIGLVQSTQVQNAKERPTKSATMLILSS